MMQNPYNKREVEEETTASWMLECEKYVLRAGKLENVKHEMTQLGINIMGISETRWPGENEYHSDQFRVIHSGGEKSQRGVAILGQKNSKCIGEDPL